VNISSCISICRSIVVRHCETATIWSQRMQACIANVGGGGPQLTAPESTPAVATTAHRPTRPTHVPNQHSAGTSNNPCRRRGPPFYRPHPTVSSGVQCTATGRAFVKLCPRGLTWNQRALTCDRSVPGGE